MKYLLIASVLMSSGCALVQKDKGLCRCDCSANCLEIEFDETGKGK